MLLHAANPVVETDFECRTFWLNSKLSEEPGLMAVQYRLCCVRARALTLLAGLVAHSGCKLSLL